MASPTVTTTTVVTVLQISDYGNGKYDIKEIASDEAVLPDLHSGNRKKFELPLPGSPGIGVVGYYDKDDNEVGLYITLFGSQVGPKYSAGLDSGLNVELNLLVASGSVGIYKEGNALKARYKVEVGLWNKDTYEDSVHLLNL